VKARFQLILAFALLSTCPCLRAQVTLLKTFTNPAPSIAFGFGIDLAMVGTDKVLIGSYGAAFLFHRDGTLLKTITNPAAGALFGRTVAAVGTNALLIGSYEHNVVPISGGMANLFSIDGTLLTTFTNPVPTSGDWDYFGVHLHAMGNDAVLIGAPLTTDLGVHRTGLACRFSTNGDLLNTFTNPSPAQSDYFGDGIVTVGDNLVIVGATGDDTGAEDAGIAYLFHSSGNLLNTFTNPTPQDSEGFGFPVVALGSDKLFIGATQDRQGGERMGAVYLFSTNGTLLNTFTDPTPELYGLFGRAVTPIGADLVVIGDYTDGTLGTLSGAAHLFRTDGTFLNTITNPMPQSPTSTSGDRFGFAIALAGAGKVLIGADGDDAAGTDKGVAYLYSIDFSVLNPKLRITATPSNAVVVAWPGPSTGWALQFSTNLTTSNWTDVTNLVVAVGSENQVVFSPMSDRKYFRLFHH